MPGITLASQDIAIDVVLVLDSSGSMKQTDPQRLRVEAGRLFISLLKAGDRVSVVSFSDQGYPVSGLTGVETAVGRKQLFESLDKISSRGIHTNLYAALGTAYEILRKQSEPSRRRAVILLSDGKMDVGDDKRDVALGAELRDVLLPLYSSEQIALHTIAFSEQADMNLLGDLARQGGGMFQLARRDRDLPEVFAALFENSEQPDMLPLIGGEFMVDESLNEVTILAMKESEGAVITLVSPDGRQHTGPAHAEDMVWQSSTNFDLITMPQPQAGMWRILASAGNSRAYVVTNLQLETGFSPRLLAPGSTVLLEAWLARDGGRVDLPELLQGVRVALELQGPDGVVRQWLNDTENDGDIAGGDGIFSTPLPVHVPGSYLLRLVADGGTFRRQLTRYFDVDSTVQPEPPAPAGLPVPLAAPAVLPAPSPEPVVCPEMASPAVPSCPEPMPADVREMKTVLLWFGSANLGFAVLMGGGIGLWLLVRKWRMRRATAAAQDAAEEG